MTVEPQRSPAGLEAGWSLLDHTADAGFDAWAPTLGGLFEQAALGMYALMVEDLDTVQPQVERSVVAQAEDREHLLVAWLLELLFLTETEGLLFRRFRVRLEGEHTARGSAWGEPLDPDRHRIGAAVKAVTWHSLAIGEDERGFRARVIVDV